MLDNRMFIINEIRSMIVKQIQENGIEYQDKIEDICDYVAKEISSEDFKGQIELYLMLVNPVQMSMKEAFRSKEKEYFKRGRIDFGLEGEIE